MAYTTIDDPSAYFKVQLWTGDDVNPRTITFDDTDTDMAPDFIWIKLRPVTHAHKLYDTVRGVNERHLVADEDSAETTGQPSDGYMSATTSDGFTINKGSSTWWNGNNSSHSSTYVAWCWKAGGSGSSNTDGSINTTSTSVDTTAGFSISTYTGTGSAATIGHGLGAIPSVVLVKKRSDAVDWIMYHISLGNGKNARLNTNEAADTSDAPWNATTPTSSVFSVGDFTGTNVDSETFVAYCFAEKQGYSKFGTYTGNGDAPDGAFVYTGFRPAWIMIKRTNSASGWMIFDNKRDGYNGDNEYLRAETNAAETGVGTYLNMFSNGFKPLSADGEWNGSGDTYIYMAFAEQPFVNSNGVPCTAR
jgi:hypothetical protein